MPLPQGAPFGTVEVKVEGCTLCLSCVSACPTGALSDDPERPMLRFAEDACVQCGLCKATCPEKVISLKPQIDFRAATASSRIIKQEEPFHCIRCGKPFGVKSSVERVAAKLEGKHWMFKDSQARLDVIKMCADCRVNAMAEENFDPFGAPQRPAARTTDDYLREREEQKRRNSEVYFVHRRLSQKLHQRLAILRPSRSSAPASWCRACRSSGRPRTVSPPSPASTRCRAA